MSHADRTTDDTPDERSAMPPFGSQPNTRERGPIGLQMARIPASLPGVIRAERHVDGGAPYGDAQSL